jgi:hypothetical protein
VTKFGVKKEGAQEPCKEKLKKKHSTWNIKSTSRSPVSFRQATSRFRNTPSYID